MFATVPYYENRYVVNQPSSSGRRSIPGASTTSTRCCARSRRPTPIGSRVVDLAGYLAPPERHGLLDDGVHFGPENRKVVGDWLAPQLRQLAR